MGQLLASRPVVVWAFVASRLLAYAAGALGQLVGARVGGWQAVDPGRLTTGLGSLGNLLAASGVRWDAIGYLDIAQHGYTHAGETILFPLYPVVVAAAETVTGSFALAGLLVSAGAFATALLLLHRLTELELGRRAADATVLLLAFAPVSFFFSAVYTESLFLLLSVGAIYAARQQRIRTAAVLAALASVTRLTGILLVIPIAMMQARQDRRLAWLGLSPAALGGFSAFMAIRGFGWLAPLTNQHAHTMGGPLATISAAVSAAGNGLGELLSGARPLAPSLAGPLLPSADSVVLLLVLVVAVAALLAAGRRLPRAYVIYAALALLVCISSQTRIQPLEGLDRYTLTIFPLWMAAGSCISRRALPAAVAAGAVLLCCYAFEFATWAFIA